MSVHRYHNEVEYDHLIKLLLLGDSAVGKSSLLMRFCEEKFESSFILTIGVDFRNKIIEAGGRRLKLQVWDTAGQERFRTITPAYFRSAMGVVLTYDVTSAESFSNLRRWLRNVDDYADGNVHKILIGNKCDLENKREVSTQRGEALAAECGMPFFEASAKDNTNVEAAFMSVANLVRETRFPSCAESVVTTVTGMSAATSLGGGNVRITSLTGRGSAVRRRCCGGGGVSFTQPPSR
eukprot:GHVQ01003377.1.p1 GENE.GHVQ01003377.1~~GHVQ01003377.1.p1  ORF type:complete len:237 (-),score=34.37 GHVQ01003377.1:1623-2333(-)